MYIRVSPLTTHRQPIRLPVHFPPANTPPPIDTRTTSFSRWTNHILLNFQFQLHRNRRQTPPSSPFVSSPSATTATRTVCCCAPRTKTHKSRAYVRRMKRRRRRRRGANKNSHTCRPTSSEQNPPPRIEEKEEENAVHGHRPQRVSEWPTEPRGDRRSHPVIMVFIARSQVKSPRRVISISILWYKTAKTNNNKSTPLCLSALRR